MINTNTLFNYRPNDRIYGLHWNTSTQPALLTGRNGKWQLTILDGETFAVSQEHTINYDFHEEIKDIALSDKLEKLLIFSKNEAIIFSFPENSIISKLRRDTGFITGGFYDDNTIWFTVPAPAGSVDWAYWDLTTGGLQVYELDRQDHYGRAAVLHPSKRLIGACFSAYASGFLLHTAQALNGQLYYANLEDDGCACREYELYAPSFSLDGGRFAVIVNQFVSMEDQEKLCVYDMLHQSRPLLRLPLQGTAIGFTQNSYFTANGGHIILQGKTAVDIVCISGKSAPSTSRLSGTNAAFIAVSPVKNQFALVQGHQLCIYEITDTPAPAVDNNSANAAADHFLQKYEEMLLPVGQFTD
ncbi:hypothetical protein F0L74_30930 [Chitinophaga agrisoli]|uniref:WD40 repeat protein n=1 Tax=Chitinophaga agrisoli TaxID=2607653 RepID=A0A5B2VQ87_9BACT|nr:hypothetical protein [Chitinophaga agrisoli]KAA2240566.1 hypothetical protein F0L74_30930 [Chitinophaga agrisoli]